MRKTVIAGNWKMHKLLNSAGQFIDDIKSSVPSAMKTETIVCAPYLFLPLLVEKAKGTDIRIAAQNMHFEEKGAFTGEVSPGMLADIGVSHCVIGHSERREMFGETDDSVNKKTHAAFAHNILPIICVGESLEQRESGVMESHIRQQVENALSGLSDEQISKTIIAYEPIWAIGTGKTATDEEANDVCKHIRKTIAELSNQEIADQVIIQYGGSVKPDNIGDLLAKSDIDGALVGGASLEADSFVKLLEEGTK
ncbi:triose-phosphate isomerase [Aciduricibacillus chroicocephali]|uniref:Triosephosphate isomerase n=1 Tax=Aciduricibacillus chroicocephali TaxID=3054939 RepID=A0ABY9KT44_9BACI|nr:triose-phosphate isomerase [Bacillaceae bacterium 44XB]